MRQVNTEGAVVSVSLRRWIGPDERGKIITFFDADGEETDADEPDAHEGAVTAVVELENGGYLPINLAEYQPRTLQ